MLRITPWGRTTRALLLWALCTVGVSASANSLEPLSDQEMGAVSGAGLALALDNFQFALSPYSYMEQVGSVPGNACSPTNTTDCWRRGDLRWYGVNISGAGAAGSHWTEGACADGSLSCPRGGTISQFSPFDNPYLVRAWSPQGMAWNGDCINGSDGQCVASTRTKSIYEFLAPTAQPDYTLSFWGEIESGRTADNSNLLVGTGDVLKSQTIIRGNAAGSVFRAFQFTEPGNETFGMYYHSYLQGDFRFSVAQAAGDDSDVAGVPVRFDGEEGLHFKNVEAFFPFGQLYYQALILNAEGTDGNFSIELPRVPSNQTVFDKFHGLQPGDSRGYETARLALAGTSTSDYDLTHGYSRWGDWYPGSTSGTRNGAQDTNDGIYFQACALCAQFQAFAKRPVRIDVRGETGSMQLTQNYDGVVRQGPGNGTTISTRVANLGDSRLEGVLINHFKLTSCAPGVC